MSYLPPKKSWADVVQSSDQSSTSTVPPQKISDTVKPVQKGSLPPPPQRIPKSAPPLPSINSKSAVQPCFDSIQERGYPLGFKDENEFSDCMEDFLDAAEEEGIECKGAGVRGSAATYKSSNPSKKGQHFDSRGKNKSDIDAFLISDKWLKCRPNRDGFCHPDKVAEEYPKLVEWGKTWSKKLGREITPAIFRPDAPALDDPYIQY